MTGDLHYILLAFVAVAVFIIFICLNRKRRNRRIAGLLLSRWGGVNERRMTADELASIREQACILAGNNEFLIDDITWNDLDMDKLYERMNVSYTDCGDHTLYETLRNPRIDVNELGSRGLVMAWAGEKGKDRERVKRILYDLGRTGKLDLEALFSRHWFSRGRYYGCMALCAALVIGIALCLSGVGYALIPTVAIAFVNIFISMRARVLIESYINMVHYIPSVLLAARRIAKDDIRELEAVNTRIPLLLGRIKGVLGSGLMAYHNGSGNPADLFLYFKLFFLMELIHFYRLARNINRHREDILEVYRLVGRVDCLIAAASWRETLPVWCTPDLDDKSPGKGIEFDQMAHPMLPDPVTNSLEIRRNMLLTGSNATGKSTFLKAVAMNAVLAQSVCTCTALRWESGFFRVFTSMALRDNIFSKESYFITEIKSLKRMFDGVNGGIPCLFIVDEVLRGTNTGERIAAASEALIQFAGQNCLCLAATHDIELTHILEGLYENMHFAETIQDNGIAFDYKIRPGRSQSRNAIKLLGLLGYGNDLVSAANARLERFETTGQWARHEYSGAAGEK